MTAGLEMVLLMVPSKKSVLVKPSYFVLVFLIVWQSITMSVSWAYGTQVVPPDHVTSRVSDNSGDFKVDEKNVYIFPGFSGPSDETLIPEERKTAITEYSHGTDNCLAVLLTEEVSSWLSLAKGLKTFGVPFIITKDYKQAFQHKVVAVYPTVSGKVLSQAALVALREFISKGGTIIGFNVIGGGLNDVFGFNGVVCSSFTGLKLNIGASPLLTSFTDEREQTISLGDMRIVGARLGGYGYKSPDNRPIAVFQDGTSAIIQKTFGRGKAYAWGIDVGDMLSRGYSGRAEAIARSYINEFEPTNDVLLRLIKEMYVNGEKNAVTLGTVPFNKALSVMLTHDVDYGKSEDNAIMYADAERNSGVQATYFLQTKYIKDWNDDAFFDVNHIKPLKKLQELGMELGSHSVAHAYAFSEFPLGSGKERYPSYQPFVSGRYIAHNGTLLGELRVSKYLIEKVLEAPLVVSFRPGHLSDPKKMPQALEAVGYLYSSTATANVSLTHLPYQLTDGYTGDGLAKVFEFPLTLEDELGEKMGSRVAPALELAKKISKYGGIYVVLIHPNVLDHKLEFEKQFISGVKDYAWFSTVKDFGGWWAARNKVTVGVAQQGSERVVTLEVPEPMAGLTIKIPPRWVLRQSATETNCIQENESVIIRKAEGRISLVFIAK